MNPGFIPQATSVVRKITGAAIKLNEKRLGGLSEAQLLGEGHAV